LRDDPNCSWEETCLEHTKQEPRSQQSAEVFHDSGQGHYDAPGHHQGSHVPAGFVELCQEEVARYLEQDVRYEEDYARLALVGEQ
jgi:hypothetical protein